MGAACRVEMGMNNRGLGALTSQQSLALFTSLHRALLLTRQAKH